MEGSLVTVITVIGLPRRPRLWPAARVWVRSPPALPAIWSPPPSIFARLSCLPTSAAYWGKQPRPPGAPRKPNSLATPSIENSGIAPPVDTGPEIKPATRSPSTSGWSRRSCAPRLWPLWWPRFTAATAIFPLATSRPNTYWRFSPTKATPILRSPSRRRQRIPGGASCFLGGRRPCGSDGRNCRGKG